MKTIKRVFYIKVEQEDFLCNQCNVPVKYKDMVFEKLPWWNIWTVPKLQYYLHECPNCHREYIANNCYPIIKEQKVENYGID